MIQPNLFDPTAYGGAVPHSLKGETFVPELDAERLTSQFRRVRAAMLCGEWMTLGEIRAITGDPEASISARTRELKAQKRRLGDPKRGLWEYRLVSKEAKHGM